jgi:transcriptional regulator with PAS, ATPase and Fis domain
MRSRYPGASPQRRRVANRSTTSRARSDRAHSTEAVVGGDEGSLRDVERAYVQGVLAKSATFKEAAKRLGIDMATLWRMRKRWDLA